MLEIILCLEATTFSLKNKIGWRLVWLIALLSSVYVVQLKFLFSFLASIIYQPRIMRGEVYRI